MTATANVLRTVSDGDAASFHAVRPRLLGIAARVLGSPADADDVVQDTWIRWHGADRSEVRDTGAFLATTTTRLAINVIQSARSRHETHVTPETIDAADPRADPVLDAEHDEALEQALRLLLEKLSPSERAAYLLREAFDYRYGEIARVLGLSEVNARQLVTRARRRLHEGPRRPAGPDELTQLRNGVIAAARIGALAALEQALAADVGGRAAA
jgi:RNA polymerase sigma-70 factor (ECF subfamily)